MPRSARTSPTVAPLASTTSWPPVWGRSGVGIRTCGMLETPWQTWSPRRGVPSPRLPLPGERSGVAGDGSRQAIVGDSRKRRRQRPVRSCSCILSGCTCGCEHGLECGEAWLDDHRPARIRSMSSSPGLRAVAGDAENGRAVTIDPALLDPASGRPPRSRHRHGSFRPRSPRSRQAVGHGGDDRVIVEASSLQPPESRMSCEAKKPSAGSPIARRLAIVVGLRIGLTLNASVLTVFEIGLHPVAWAASYIRVADRPVDQAQASRIPGNARAACSIRLPPAIGATMWSGARCQPRSSAISEAHRLRPLGVKGAEIHVHEAPAELEGDLRAEPVDLVVVPFDGDHLRPVDGGAEHLALLEAIGDQDVGFEPGSRSIGRDAAASEVPHVDGAADGLEPELELPSESLATTIPPGP